MKLTDHFTLEEMTFSQTASRLGIPNSPWGVTVNNLTRLCRTLEEVRTLLGRPLNITSGYRSPALNSATPRSSKTSQHMNGCAADFNVKGMTPDEVVKAIMSSDIQYDQLNREFSSWTHISVPNVEGSAPRRESLIIDSKGTRPYA